MPASCPQIFTVCAFRVGPCTHVHTHKCISRNQGINQCTFKALHFWLFKCDMIFKHFWMKKKVSICFLIGQNLDVWHKWGCLHRLGTLAQPSMILSTELYPLKMLAKKPLQTRFNYVDGSVTTRLERSSHVAVVPASLLTCDRLTVLLQENTIISPNEQDWRKCCQQGQHFKWLMSTLVTWPTFSPLITTENYFFRVLYWCFGPKGTCAYSLLHVCMCNLE